jgi:hypothetical protein
LHTRLESASGPVNFRTDCKSGRFCLDVPAAGTMRTKRRPASAIRWRNSASARSLPPGVPSIMFRSARKASLCPSARQSHPPSGHRPGPVTVTMPRQEAAGLAAFVFPSPVLQLWWHARMVA